MGYLKIFSISVFLFILFFSNKLYAEDFPSISDDKSYPNGAFVELGAGHNPNTIGGEIGFFSNPSKYNEIKASFAFIGSEKNEDIFTGASIGIRFQIGETIKPFAGIGVFAGYTKKEVNANDDKEDNDKDGKIDEPDEKKTVIDNTMGTVYPEAGIHFLFLDHTRITFAAKYHFTSEGRENDFTIYSMAYSVLF